ncbi:bifunctional proline dehydrogenase/L-glutamate gamma-semialdehyde dehydrogenase [Georgenia sp. Z1344]|uniref:bifunctional proline dehydrogenase/L-glutamate gamma-semialdehyde dehydrogenase n=1 Tax=Georgenia sp. Z1344 TaxID=3416706 RepID=UPI003CF49622
MTEGPPADDAIDLARSWAEASAAGERPEERAATRRLADLLADPAGLDLAVRFVDRVARPEDLAVAARELSRIGSASGATFLSGLDRAMLGAGARVGRLAPSVVVPLARRRLRQLVGHLVVDATDAALTDRLQRAARDGERLNLNLLGEAVLGETEAADRARRTLDLVSRPDVEHVSVKVSTLVPQISTWDTEGTVERVGERLRPIYRAALAREQHVFVNLDMEEYRDLDLTVEAFTSILAEEEFTALSAGIVLQAYLPDSAAALDRLVAFARGRRDAGGAPIGIRLVKGANLSMERVEAELRGWHQAPFTTKAETDAAYLRLLDRALRPENVGALRIGIASHNLFHVAHAHLLAAGRGVADMVDVEMLQGMAPAQARAVAADAGRIVLYTPVVAPQDMDSAIGYLVRRLEEAAAPENFVHAFASGDPGELEAQERDYVAAADASASPAPAPRRTGAPVRSDTRFVQAVDTDPALAASRVWAAEHLAAPRREPSSPAPTSVSAVDDAVARALEARATWAALEPGERAGVLRAAADDLEDRRGELVGQAAAEAGKLVDESDPEVSEAVDFLRYYADRAEDLGLFADHLDTDGARFEPDRLVVVTPPWNFPVAIPTGGTAAALAAGSAVIVKPAPQTPVLAEIVVDTLRTALERGGLDPDVVQFLRARENEVGQRLITHEDVDRVVLTGSTETARLFAGWRAGRPGGHGVIAETSGKNAMVITASADYDLAVADLVRSAFGHTGQKCSAASVAVLVGQAGTSDRLRRQLVDAVSSLRVGMPDDLGVTTGPLTEPASGRLLHALTELDEGQSWLVRPRRLDGEGRLWSPGVLDNVAPGSRAHLTEFFGPVLALVRTETLDEAIEVVNRTDFGLTSGLHSLDPEEIERWSDQVDAGNLYVNRHCTGAIVRRQPFGGWKDSSVGPGAKAGGPNYVTQLGSWIEDGLPARAAEPSPEVRAALADLTGIVPVQSERRWLRAAVRSDAYVWEHDLGREQDPTGLEVESNVLRYRQLPVLHVRAGADARTVDLVRLLLAGEVTGTLVRVSLHPELSAHLKSWATEGEPARRALRRLTEHVAAAEGADAFVGRLAGGRGRVRVLGSEREELADLVADVRYDVSTAPVLATGRRELLTMLREQAVSTTLHRLGHLPAGR